MKIALKIIAKLLLTITIVIVLAGVSIKIFEKGLALIAINQIEKEINSPIELGNIDINILRDYPMSTITLEDVWLKAPNDVDTIAGVKRLYFSVNSKEAIDGNYKINKVTLDGLQAHYYIGSDSIPNIDYLMSLMSSTDTLVSESNDTSTIQIDLQEIELRNILCSYFDSTTNMGGKMQIPAIDLQGNINDDQYTINTGGNITLTDVTYGNYNMHLMQEAKLSFEINYDNDSINIPSFLIESEGIYIKGHTSAHLSNSIKMNSVIEKATFDLGHLIKYAPKEMLQEEGIISAEGIIELSSEISGTYNDSTLPLVELNFNLKDIALKTSEYPEVKYFSTQGSLTNGDKHNNQTTTISINKLQLKTSESEFNLQAKINNIDQPYYNASTQGYISIREFKDYIPDSTLETIAGIIRWDINTYGQMPKEINDDFNDYAMARTTADFTIQDLNTTIDSSLSIASFNSNIKYSPNQISIDDVHLEIPNYDIKVKDFSTQVGFVGKSTDIDNIALNIDAFHLAFDNNEINFNGELSNLYAPDYNINTELNFDLSDLQKFAPDTLITKMSGIAKAQIKSTGHINLDSIETEMMNLAFKHSSIQLQTENLSVSMTDTLLSVDNLNLEMSMQNDSILLPYLEGKYKSMGFQIDSTYIANAYNTVILNQTEEVSIYTSIEMGQVDYALFEPFMEESTEQAEVNTVSEVETNYTFKLRGNLAIDKFILNEYTVDSTMTLHNLNIDNISTTFLATDSTYIADQLKFEVLGGKLNTSVRYDIRENDTRIRFKNEIDNIDFKTLLYNMDNFGQTEISHENISGQLFSSFNAEVIMIGDSIDTHATKLKGDFKLTNGGLYNHESLTELSKFTGIKELDNIRFLTLETSIFVLNGAIYVPETEIVNTAVDITAYGMQSFLEDYEYHLELNLGDVLTGKRSKLVERQEKAGKDEGKEVNRNGVNLIAYSLDGKTKNKFDNKTAQQSMIRKIRVQKNLLGLKFYPKLFNFDTTKALTPIKKTTK